MGTRTRLGDVLIALKLITSEQLDTALEVQREDTRSLGDILVSLGFLTEDLMLYGLATQMDVRPWRVEEVPPTFDAVQTVPRHVCRARQVLPVALHGERLVLAMANPLDFDALDLVRNLTGLQVEPVLADAGRLLTAIDHAHDSQSQSAALDTLVQRVIEHLHAKAETPAVPEDTRLVVRLVNQILSDAVVMGASDVHIEPRPDRVELRYRVAGQLRKVRELPLGFLPLLGSRLEEMLHLDEQKGHLPREGRVSVAIGGRDVDLRASVLPSVHGGRFVLRIHDKSRGVKRLNELGFERDDLTLFRSLVTKPHGLFLVAGPAGSGKTTTLYAALQELKPVANNVMTCEDPVEHEIPGVSQSQVDEKQGFGFPQQLRAILRQDPDVIMVGDMPDAETSETAVRAALAGHTVLAALRCNDAPSAIPYLLDMGIDPSLLGTSLIGVMSQRLLRVLCPHCQQAAPPSAADLDLVAAHGEPCPQEIWEPGGCPACEGTGYQGRVAVHEIMPVTPAVARLIATREPVETIREVAAEFGYRPLQLSALEMVLLGRTSLESPPYRLPRRSQHGVTKSLELSLQAA